MGLRHASDLRLFLSTSKLLSESFTGRVIPYHRLPLGGKSLPNKRTTVMELQII